MTHLQFWPQQVVLCLLCGSVRVTVKSRKWSTYAVLQPGVSRPLLPRQPPHKPSLAPSCGSILWKSQGLHRINLWLCSLWILSSNFPKSIWYWATNLGIYQMELESNEWRLHNWVMCVVGVAGNAWSHHVLQPTQLGQFLQAQTWTMLMS